MRSAGVLAALSAVGLLAAGCSPATETPGTGKLTPISPSRQAGQAAPSGTGTTTSSPTTTSKSTAAPAAGATVDEAIAWVQAAGPVDTADFQVALRGGTSTPLGEDVAFTTPAGTSCMTDLRRGAGDLACLVNLADPPPAPADIYGVWKGGWVDFDGAAVRIGSAHGDPGRFAAGQGAPLPPDRSLSFGDFRCRTDASALLCVNYARQTAVRYSDDGIDAYGCTRRTPPAAGVGIEYAC
ncbi:MAG: hypothetical protein QG597_2622 [Actinomycetota bacterium]|nr:hypothetical protein [Actinomycetota bacterium]